MGGGEENVLRQIVVMVVHYKQVNCLVCELNLNRTVIFFKKEREKERDRKRLNLHISLPKSSLASQQPRIKSKSLGWPQKKSTDNLVLHYFSVLSSAPFDRYPDSEPPGFSSSGTHRASAAREPRHVHSVSALLQCLLPAVHLTNAGTFFRLQEEHRLSRDAFPSFSRESFSPFWASTTFCL